MKCLGSSGDLGCGTALGFLNGEPRSGFLPPLRLGGRLYSLFLC